MNGLISWTALIFSAAALVLSALSPAWLWRFLRDPERATLERARRVGVAVGLKLIHDHSRDSDRELLQMGARLRKLEGRPIPLRLARTNGDPAA